MQKKQKKVTSKLEVKLITSRKKNNPINDLKSLHDVRHLRNCTESPFSEKQIYLSPISYFYT